MSFQNLTCTTKLPIYLSTFSSFCFLICLSSHPSIFLSFYHFISLSFHLFVFPSFCPFIFLSFYLFIFLSFHLYLFIFLSFHLFVFLSFYLLIFLSFHLSIFSSFCLFISLIFFLSIFLSFYLIKVTALAIADNDSKSPWRIISGGSKGKVRIWNVTSSHQVQHSIQYRMCHVFCIVLQCFVL